MSIRNLLEQRHIWYETLIHSPAATASRRAQNIHVKGRALAKGVLFHAGARSVLVVLPATHHVDPALLGQVLGETEIRIASEEDIARIFDDCELGALPPFGHLYGIETIVDLSIACEPEVVFITNERHVGVRMHYRDYEMLESPRLACVAGSENPPRTRSPRRRAG